MTKSIEPGLGELLRHLIELTDKSVERWYGGLNFKYRPRYTPLMRALEHGSSTVTDLTVRLAITQGAVSQTVKLMVEDGLVVRKQGGDARQAIIELSEHGCSVLKVLKPQWAATFSAIESLEQETSYPIRNCLGSAISALEERSFSKRIEDCKQVALRSETDTSEDVADHFQSGGKRYASFRPAYSSLLAEDLAKLTSQHNLAIDVGCGNGQLTTLLSPHFQQVIGTDTSKDQLAHAQIKPNVRYLHEAAENIGVSDSSVDFIVVAQAAHWFDLDKFYEEVHRVAKPGAVIALVSYGVPYIADGVNSLFQQGYWQDIYKYWPPERRHVENGYSEINFPFLEISFPSHSIRKQMEIDEFIGYITTWSAFGNAKKAGEIADFEEFFKKIRSAWKNNEVKEVVWPISVKAGLIS